MSCLGQKTLNETFDLEIRWTNTVNSKLDKCVSVFVAKAARDKERGLQFNHDRVLKLIQDDIAWQRHRLGKEERTLRQVAALEYQLTQMLPENIADFL